MAYDAFVSYSHAADGRLAPALQRGMQRLARPWYRARALRVFRDESALSANPHLWQSIQSALDESRWFVLLASPEAVRSGWVNRELEYWLATKSVNRLLPVLTDGTWDWIDGRLEGTAVSPPLARVFSEEPRHLDLRWAHVGAELDLGNARFRDAVAQLAAPVHGVAKDELESEDVRLQRRARRLARGALVALALLTASAVTFGVVAVGERDRADRQTVVADRQTIVADSGRLAAEARRLVDGHLDLALLLAVEARHMDDSVGSRGALEAAYARAAPLEQLIQFGPASTSAVLSRDGRFLAVGRADGTIEVRALGSSQPSTRIATGGGAVGALAFGPDDRTLAVGRPDGTVELRDVATGARRAVWTSGLRNGYVDLVFSPDGHQLAGTDLQSVVVWNLRSSATGTVLPEFRVGGPEWFPAWSPDSRTLATAHTIGVALLWDTSTERPIGNPVPTDDVRSALAFSPNGRTLAVGTTHGDVDLFDVQSRRHIGEPLHGLQQTIAWIAFSPDGTTIAAADHRGTVVLWDTANHQPRDPQLPALTAATEAGVLTADHTLVTLGNTAAAVWRLGTPTPALGRLVWDFGPVPGGATLTRAGPTFVFAPVFGDTYVLWDTRRQRGVVHPSGKLTGNDIAWDPASSTLAAGNADGRVLLDDATRGQSRWVVGHAGQLESVAFSRDGHQVAAGGSNGTALVWNVATGRQQGPAFAAGGNEIWGVAFSPDSRTLATASLTGSVRLYDVASHRALHALDTHQVLFHLAFSPDGRTLAIAGAAGPILIDVATGQTRGRPFAAQTTGLFDIAFSDDGKTLATTSADGTANLSDVATGLPIGEPLAANYGPTKQAAFSADGRTLAVAYGDGKVVMFDIDPDSWQQRACTIAGRNLTRDEWHEYLGDRPYHNTCAQWPQGQ